MCTGGRDGRACLSLPAARSHAAGVGGCGGPPGGGPGGGPGMSMPLCMPAAAGATAEGAGRAADASAGAPPAPVAPVAVIGSLTMSTQGSSSAMISAYCRASQRHEPATRMDRNGGSIIRPPRPAAARPRGQQAARSPRARCPPRRGMGGICAPAVRRGAARAPAARRRRGGAAPSACL